MLQRVVAVVLAVLGLSTVVLGALAGTAWKPDERVTANAAPAGEPSTLLVTDPGVLDLVADDVTITASRDDGGPVVLAIGREADVLGWVGEDAHAVARGLANWTQLKSEFIAGKTVPVEDSEANAEDSGTNGADAEASGIVGPDPATSDMWVASATGDGRAELTWESRKGGFLLLVANTGDDAPVPNLTLSWEREVSTPLVLPAIIVGSVLLIAGALLFTMTVRRPARTPAASASSRSATPPKPSAPSTASVSGEPSSSLVPSAAGEPAGLGLAAPIAGIRPAGPTTPLVESTESADTQEQQRPMSRRELRELAEREAAERARSRRSTRFRVRRGTADGQDEQSARSVESTRSTRSALSARSSRSARSAVSMASSASAATGSFPKVDQTTPRPEDPGHLPEDSTRADAWRRAWGFQQSWDPDPTGSPAGEATPPTDASGPDDATTLQPREGDRP